MASIGVFGLLNIVAIMGYLRSKLSATELKYVFTAGGLAIGAVILGGAILLSYAGVVAPWSGR